MDAQELEKYCSRYYLSPNPSLAPAAMQWFVSSPFANDPNARRPAQYFFSRLVEMHPELREEIARACSLVPVDRAPLLNEVLAASHPPAKVVNALDRPDDTEQLNDLLWAEFSLTGQPAAVERLISVLDRPDLIRERIEEWLKPGAMARLIRQPIVNRRCSRLQKELGIVCDTTNHSVKTQHDLDCLCALEGLEVDIRRFQRARMILPFGLNDEDVRYILAKVTAKWSLASRAREESKVRQICENQIDRRTGRTRLSLLEIVAFAEAAQGRPAATGELAAQYLSSDPDHKGMRTLLAAARSRLELDELMSLAIPDTRAELGDRAEAARHCMNVTESAWSYRTRYVVSGTSDSGQKERIEWNLEFYDPGRFHVVQEAQPSGDCDEWIAIGDDVWRQPLWFHRSGSELTTGEHALDTRLGTEPYLELLSKKGTSGGFTVEAGGRRFTILEFMVGPTDRQVPLLESQSARTYRVWISEKSWLISRVDIHLTNADGTCGSADGCHVFSSYNEKISIEPPEASARPVIG